MPRSPSATFANQRPGVAYVGTAACVDCHSLLAESFAAHGMARTFARMDSTPIVADWATNQVVIDQATGLRYQPYRDSSRFFMREFLLDETGKEIHSLSREAHFALGSGTNDQAYLSEQNGFLRMLPLEWYADDKRWEFAPGFDVSNQRFSRRVNGRCMSCHNAPVTFESEAASRFATPLPSGISCERCHGPGALHVQARLQGYAPATGIDTTIVNPHHLPAARQLDICAQCHLQGDAEMIRPGKSQLSFRPGERLAAHRALFVSRGAAADTSDFGFVRHVERLVQSRCFSESSGAMTCTTCHNPHQSSVGRPPGEWDAACAKCHNVDDCGLHDMEARAGGTCVGCHMRRSEPYDVRHVTITDHWIRRRIEPPARNAVTRFRPDPGSPVEMFALPGEKQAPTAEDLELLAVASSDLGLRTEAQAALIEAAARRGPARSGLSLASAASHLRDSRAREAVANLLASKGDSAAARAVLERAVADDPQDARLAASLARMEAAQGELEAALTRARAAEALDPDDPELARLVAELMAEAGEYRLAATRFAQALELDPEDSATLLGRVRSLLRLGNHDRAAEASARAAAELPFSAEAHGSLGFALAATKQARPAIDAYRRALALAPADADLHFNLGNALAAAGESQAAEASYREAIRLRPNHFQAYGNLGFLLRDRGDRDGARRAFERVLELNPKDAIARKALEELSE